MSSRRTWSIFIFRVYDQKKKPLSISSHAIIYLSLDELLSLTLILLCVPTSIRPIITDLCGFEMGGLMRIERLHQNL